MHLKILNVNYKVFYKTIFNIILGLTIFILVPKIADSDKIQNSHIVSWIIICLILSFRFIVLNINYAYNDLFQKVTFNDNEIIVQKKGVVYKYKFPFMKKCYLVEATNIRGAGTFVFNYHYCCILLNDGNKLFITSMSQDMKKTLDNIPISYSHIKSIVPFVDKKIGETLIDK